VLLLAPVWLQLVHLVLADALWIAAVVAAGRSVEPGGSREISGEPAVATSG
jgi:cytochrome c oxidase assembly protein subunit 15